MIFKKILGFSALALSVNSFAVSDLSFIASYASPNWEPVDTNTHSVDCQLLTGENTKGVIVAGEYENRTIKYLTSYAAANWKQLSDPDMPVTHISGENQFGVVIAGGLDNRTVKYMNNYNQNIWSKELRKAPFDIQGLAGSNYRGPIVFNGRKIAFMNSYAANQWYIVRSEAPFDIAGISGENTYGAIAHSGSENQIAYINNYNGNWSSLQTPIDGTIVDVEGDNFHGMIVAYETGEVFYASSYSPVNWQLVDFRTGPQIDHLTGSVTGGPIICAN